MIGFAQAFGSSALDDSDGDDSDRATQTANPTVAASPDPAPAPALAIPDDEGWNITGNRKNQKPGSSTLPDDILRGVRSPSDPVLSSTTFLGQFVASKSRDITSMSSAEHGPCLLAGEDVYQRYVGKPIIDIAPAPNPLGRNVSVHDLFRLVGVDIDHHDYDMIIGRGCMKEIAGAFLPAEANRSREFKFTIKRLNGGRLLFFNTKEWDMRPGAGYAFEELMTTERSADRSDHGKFFYRCFELNLGGELVVLNFCEIDCVTGDGESVELKSYNEEFIPIWWEYKVSMALGGTKHLYVGKHRRRMLQPIEYYNLPELQEDEEVNKHMLKIKQTLLWVKNEMQQPHLQNVDNAVFQFTASNRFTIKPEKLI